MPLIAVTLKNEIRKVIDEQDFDGFIEYPDNYTSLDAVNRWATAFDNYYADFLSAPALPVSAPIRALAKAKMILTWGPLFAFTEGSYPLLTMFQKGIDDYITEIFTGMNTLDTLNTWTKTSMPVPEFDEIFRDGKEDESSAEDIAKLIADKAHSWMKLGQAQLIAQPNTITVFTSLNP